MRVFKYVGIISLGLAGFIFSASAASAASLYFYPQHLSLVPGQEALVDIRLETDGQVVNAVELEGALSGVAATLRAIDSSGSAIEVFVERPSVKGKGVFRLVGGVPGGLSGEHVLARLVVRAEMPGVATLSFAQAKTKVLLADGTGDSVPLQLLSTTIAVRQKTKDDISVSSLTHPDQNQWYKNNKAQIHFDFDPKASYSYVVTRNPLEDPDDIADRPEGSAVWQGDIKLEKLPEGVTYFAVKKVGSAAVSRYRLMIDSLEPIWSEVSRSAGTVETEQRPFLNFLAQDVGSGIDYYEMRIDGQEPFTVVSPQPLPDEYKILSIRAYDRAGNYIEKFIPGPKKDYALWVWVAILFVLLVWVSGVV